MKLNKIIFLSVILIISGNIFAQKDEPVKPEKTKTETTKTETNKTEPVKTETVKKETAVKLPAAKEVIEKYVTAIGGRQANEKFKTRLIKMNVELAPMGIKGAGETYMSAPDKSYSKVNLAGIGEIIEAYDGTIAWSVNPIQGNREKTGVELAQTKLASNFYRDINLDKLYSKMEVKGIEKVGENDAYAVIANSEGLDPETFYFDVKTGLLLRSDSTLVSPEGKMPAKVFYEDYRDVDGIKIAFKTRSVLPQVEIVSVYTEVKNDVSIDDKMFTKPKQP